MKKYAYNTLGQELRDRRNEYNLTKKDMAKKLNCSEDYILDIELGSIKPQLQTIKILCKELKLDQKYLIERYSS